MTVQDVLDKMKSVDPSLPVAIQTEDGAMVDALCAEQANVESEDEDFGKIGSHVAVFLISGL